MNLIIVPRWLELALAAHGMPLTDACDVKKVLSITSVEDVSVYAKVNSWPIKLSGDTAIFGSDALVSKIIELAGNRAASYMQYLDMKNNAVDIAEHLIGRNYVEGAPLCYSCTVVDENNIIVTVGQHDVEVPLEEIIKADKLFRERLFGQHLVTKSLTQMAGSPVFINYLKGLAA